MFKNIAIAAIFFLANPVSAEGLGIEGTRVEVDKFFDSYLAVFAAQDTELLAEQYIVAPMYIATGKGMIFLESRDSVVGFLGKTYSYLNSQNYSRAEIVTGNTCVLNENSAIWSGVLARYNTEGVVMGESGNTYFIGKLNGSWQISSLLQHTPELVVSCEM